MQSFTYPNLVYPSFEVLSRQVFRNYTIKCFFKDIGHLFDLITVISPYVEAVVLIFSIIFVSKRNDILYLLVQVQHISAFLMNGLVHDSYYFQSYSGLFIYLQCPFSDVLEHIFWKDIAMPKPKHLSLIFLHFTLANIQAILKTFNS